MAKGATVWLAMIDRPPESILSKPGPVLVGCSVEWQLDGDITFAVHHVQPTLRIEQIVVKLSKPLTVFNEAAPSKGPS